MDRAATHFDLAAHAINRGLKLWPGGDADQIDHEFAVGIKQGAALHQCGNPVAYVMAVCFTTPRKGDFRLVGPMFAVGLSDSQTVSQHGQIPLYFKPQSPPFDSPRGDSWWLMPEERGA